MSTARQSASAARGGAPTRAGPAGVVARAESLVFVAWAVILVGVSGGLLWALGLNYDGLSGSAASKIHPSTYLAVALAGWTLLRAGNPVIPVAQALNRRPASVLVTVCGVLLLALIAARGGTGLAGAIDTFVLAGLVPILLLNRDAATLARLETVFHLVLLANAALGLFEFASGQRLFPFRMDGMAFETDTRSAALQGHPLGNATLTACYILALATGGGRLGPALRAGMIALQLVALVTFGGRSATVTTLVLGGGVGMFALAGLLRGGRVPLIGAACACFALTLVPVALALLAAIGFFDTLLSRFVSDGGSAKARVDMLAVFDAIPFRDLLLGPDLAQVTTLRRIYGLEWGIENSILSDVLYHGILMTTLLVVAVGLYLAEIARACRRGVWLPILSFVILVNTFEGLAGKTTLLAKFALMLIVLYPPGRVRQPA
ncbi:VpsF family polysaccharide biosynthesis protein [Methylobacterium sp. J-026]|uniref:VpsF family polysaccharide biosynthesis protein n=1 Tax=Methylobacterium sp. J-026 TaxID=2836624 RepID=UPI001FB9DD04|nr:VpsF family polysaccharide biosynthesis protein [Methylobacterium sp. J-026]MCJ2134599.1 VpsF family polysaccharide biosynthesis protein [Methylobacterium sp. J-026]